MDAVALARAAEDAWQRLRPGIDLMNLLLVDQLIRESEPGSPSRTAAWDALRQATVLADPSRIEPAFADLHRFWDRLVRLARSAGVPVEEASEEFGLLADAPVTSLTALLSALSEARTLLRTLAEQPHQAAGFAAVAARADRGWRDLSTPAQRQAAVTALGHRAEQALSPR